MLARMYSRALAGTALSYAVLLIGLLPAVVVLVVLGATQP